MENIERLYHAEFVDEINELAKTYHAEIVYAKLIKAKKYSLAQKIADEYKLKTELWCNDRLMAHALSLMYYTK